jgi:hypothetical protein
MYDEGRLFSDTEILEDVAENFINLILSIMHSVMA